MDVKKWPNQLFGYKSQKYLLLCEIKFLICIPKITSVKFAIFETNSQK